MEYFPVIIVLAVIAYFLLLKRKPKLQQVPVDLLPETFIVFDLETTGLNAEKHEIIEVAAMRFKKGTNTHDTFQSLVKPKKAVPQKITELTGITEAMVQSEGKMIDEVLVEFSKPGMRDNRDVSFARYHYGTNCRSYSRRRRRVYRAQPRDGHHHAGRKCRRSSCQFERGDGTLSVRVSAPRPRASVACLTHALRHVCRAPKLVAQAGRHANASPGSLAV